MVTFHTALSKDTFLSIYRAAVSQLRTSHGRNRVPFPYHNQVYNPQKKNSYPGNVATENTQDAKNGSDVILISYSETEMS